MMHPRWILLTACLVLAAPLMAFAPAGAGAAPTHSANATTVMRLSKAETTADLSPAIAVGANGHVAAAWSQRGVDKPGIYITWMDERGGWSPPLLVPNSSGRFLASAPTLAVDGGGRALIAWSAARVEGVTTVEQKIALAWMVPGARRIQPTRYLDARPAVSPVVAISKSGLGMIAWKQHATDPALEQSLHVMTVGAGLVTGTAAQVDGGTSGGVADDPDLAVDAQGRGLLVYTWHARLAAQAGEIRQARIASNGAVTAPEILESEQFVAVGAPSIDVNPSGAVLAAWSRGCGGGEIPCRGGIVVGTAGSVAGGLVAPATRLTNPGNAIQAFPLGVTQGDSPVAAIGANGRGVVTWGSGDDTLNGYLDAAQYGGGTFGPAIRIRTRHYPAHSTVAAVSGSQVTWLWLDQEADDMPHRPWSARGTLNGDNTLTIARSAQPVAQVKADTPALGAAPNGTVVGVWRQDNKILGGMTNVVDRSAPKLSTSASGVVHRLDLKRRVGIKMQCPTGELRCSGRIVLRWPPQKPGSPGIVIGSAFYAIDGGETDYVRVPVADFFYRRLLRNERITALATINVSDVHRNRAVVKRRWTLLRRGIVLEP